MLASVLIFMYNETIYLGVRGIRNFQNIAKWREYSRVNFKLEPKKRYADLDTHGKIT